MCSAPNLPKLSVLLPVYNAEQYLCECLDSILKQTFHDFEVIAINDASTDSSLSILERYAKIDSRIKVFSNASNMKLPATLNRGIELSSAPLIVRMDADDIAYPNRLQCQYDFMQSHTDVAVCGTAIKVLGTNNIWAVPESDDAIRAELVFNSPILHPTVIYKKIIIENNKGYDVNTIYAQDYELWHRLSKDKKIKFANINTPLLLYRLTSSNKSESYHKIQKETAISIRKKQLKLIGAYPTKKQLNIHNMIASYKEISSLSNLIAVYSWLQYLVKLPQASQALVDTCWRYWKYICLASQLKPISYILYFILLPINKKLAFMKNIFCVFKNKNLM